MTPAGIAPREAAGICCRQAGLTPRVLWWAALGAAALVGIAKLVAIGRFVLSPGLEQTDFSELYFLAGAIRKGLDPNMPLPALGRALGLQGFTVLPGPTPIPPTAGLLLQPLAWLPYGTAAIVWRLGILCALTALVLLLVRLAGVRIPPWAVPCLVLAAVLWEPVYRDLQSANLSIIGAGLLAVVVVCLQSNHSRLAGVFIAIDLLLKPIAWPVLLLLVVRRKWSSVWPAVATGGIVSAVTVATVGPLSAWRYLTHSLPVATRNYQLDWFNMSLLSLPNRLFVGTRYDIGPVRQGDFLPLTWAPQAAAGGSVFLAVAILGGALYATRRMELGRAVAVCALVGLLVSPTMWVHYTVAAAVPGAMLAETLHRHFWPGPLIRSLAGACSPLLLPHETLLAGLVRHVAVPGKPFSFPVTLSLPMLLPTFALVALGVLFIAVDKRFPAQSATKTCFAPSRTFMAEQSPQATELRFSNSL